MFLLEHSYFYFRIHSPLDDVWRVESGLGVEGRGFTPPRSKRFYSEVAENSDQDNEGDRHP